MLPQWQQIRQKICKWTAFSPTWNSLNANWTWLCGQTRTKYKRLATNHQDGPEKYHISTAEYVMVEQTFSVNSGQYRAIWSIASGSEICRAVHSFIHVSKVFVIAISQEWEVRCFATFFQLVVSFKGMLRECTRPVGGAGILVDTVGIEFCLFNLVT